MPDHPALLLPAKRAQLVVTTLPEIAPGPGEIAVCARAVAVNPFDRLLQTMGDIIAGYLRYPAVLGTDVAGEVVAVGEGVERFRVGDRVLGHATGTEKGRRAAEGAFQERVLLPAHMAAPIPPSMPFEAAAVLPLGLSTAACALFQPDQLALAPPQADPQPRGETVVVWGGSTSVGANAIQLARAAGYEVIATCSPRNFDFVRGLGAAQAFNYASSTVRDEVVAALQGRRCAGAVAIGQGSAAACVDVVARCGGRRFVAQVTPPASFDEVPAGRGRWRRLLPAIARMVRGALALGLRARRHRVAVKMVWGGSLIDTALGPLVYESFLPKALAQGRYQAAPAPCVVGEGLRFIPEALERQRRGVSAAKLVVTL